MITGFLGARLTNFLMLATSSKMIFLTLAVVTGMIVIKKKNKERKEIYNTHYTLYGEKNEYMVNFQTVYSVGMSEECEMSKEVNEK